MKEQIIVVKKMINKLKKIVDITFLKFLAVGVANTIFGTAVMFISYNVLDFNYWISSALNYVMGSILSYFLNKNFTFQNKSKSYKTVIRFVINISICYLIAYGTARPLIEALLSSQNKKIQENVAMFAGMVLFVGLNYIGQRFWAFREEQPKEKDR